MDEKKSFLKKKRKYDQRLRKSYYTKKYFIQNYRNLYFNKLSFLKGNETWNIDKTNNKLEIKDVNNKIIMIICSICFKEIGKNHYCNDICLLNYSKEWNWNEDKIKNNICSICNRIHGKINIKKLNKYEENNSNNEKKYEYETLKEELQESELKCEIMKKIFILCTMRVLKENNQNINKEKWKKYFEEFMNIILENNKLKSLKEMEKKNFWDKNKINNIIERLNFHKYMNWKFNNKEFNNFIKTNVINIREKNKYFNNINLKDNENQKMIIEGFKNIILIKIIKDEIIKKDKIKLEFFKKGNIIKWYNLNIIKSKVAYKDINNINMYTKIMIESLKNIINKEKFKIKKRLYKTLTNLYRIYNITKKPIIINNNNEINGSDAWNSIFEEEEKEIDINEEEIEETQTDKEQDRIEELHKNSKNKLKEKHNNNLNLWEIEEEEEKEEEQNEEEEEEIEKEKKNYTEKNYIKKNNNNKLEKNSNINSDTLHNESNISSDISKNDIKKERIKNKKNDKNKKNNKNDKDFAKNEIRKKSKSKSKKEIEEEKLNFEKDEEKLNSENEDEENLSLNDEELEEEEEVEEEDGDEISENSF